MNILLATLGDPIWQVLTLIIVLAPDPRMGQERCSIPR
jgi:hypothetical protein